MNTAEVPSGHPYAHPLEVAVAGRDFKANPTQTDGAIGTALGADQFVCENQLEVRRGGWTGPAHILVVDIGAQGAHAQLGVRLVIVFHLDPCLG